MFDYERNMAAYKDLFRKEGLKQGLKEGRAEVVNDICYMEKKGLSAEEILKIIKNESRATEK